MCLILGLFLKNAERHSLFFSINYIYLLPLTAVLLAISLTGNCSCCTQTLQSQLLALQCVWGPLLVCVTPSSRPDAKLRVCFVALKG